MHKEKDLEAGDETQNQSEENTVDSSSGVLKTIVDVESEAPGETLGVDSLRDDSLPPKEKPPLYGILPEVAAAGVETFDDLPLHETVRQAVRTIGWATPTPVQKLCLPYTLRGRHVAGFAQTGTGKTAVFLLTICNQILNKMATVAAEKDKEPTGPGSAAPQGNDEILKVRAVVLAPTRELAMQIEQDAEVMLQNAGLSSLTVIGGLDYDKQVKRIREGVDVIFATPGRLKDYVQKRHVDLSAVQVFVCDEADRMFDMGFIEDVEFFLEKIPESAQRLLFSATTNDEVKELAFEYLETPEYISVNPEEITPEKIIQRAFHCHATEKLRVMLGMLAEHEPDCAIVFTNTKLTAEWLHFKLENNGIEADLITGDLPQSKRIRLIQRIKEGKLKALIATDVASRGLHISRITHVYNFDLPEEPANYVHRIGRTARAGAKGNAYSLVCDDYGHNFSGINELLGPNGTIETLWPPESYLAIQDKAGNPFAERYKAWEEQKERNRSGGRSFRSEGGSREGRGGRGRSEGGGYEGRGPHPQSDRGGRNQTGPGGRRRGGAPQDQRGRQQSASGQSSRERKPFQGQQQGQRGGGRDRTQGTDSFRSRGPKDSPRRGDDASGQHRKSQHGAPPFKSGTSKGIEAQKPSFLQLVRRLIKAIFGWKK